MDEAPSIQGDYDPHGQLQPFWYDFLRKPALRDLILCEKWSRPDYLH
ncbi:unnamed protein product [Gongylonema pulchrum]|uniref:Uncharacterized protein n=1 Tax=Gongylonema pulchrum TaxID=637853 RepID=A0A3P6NRU3_9BILA|nr:unnamed protein product [Gongylonema pulchrum]